MSGGRGPAAILVEAPVAGAAPDRTDSQVQAGLVAAALARLGFAPRLEPVTLDLAALAARLHADPPVLAFNLVEQLAGRDALLALPALLVADRGIPLTGAPAAALAALQDKRRVAAWLGAAGLPVAAQAQAERSIVKSATEHASFAIDAASVVAHADVAAAIAAREAAFGGRWFAEPFIDGREFNLGLLAGAGGEPRTLPVAEIAFVDFPTGAPRLLSYAAKWDEAHPDYRRTVRRFDGIDGGLAARLAALGRQCWRALGLAGYARVDFRVDAQGRPWIIDVNANPGLGPDSGFVAQALQAGIDFDEIVGRLVEDALERRT